MIGVWIKGALMISSYEENNNATKNREPAKDCSGAQVNTWTSSRCTSAEQQGATTWRVYHEAAANPQPHRNALNDHANFFLKKKVWVRLMLWEKEDTKKDAEFKAVGHLYQQVMIRSNRSRQTCIRVKTRPGQTIRLENQESHHPRISTKRHRHHPTAEISKQNRAPGSNQTGALYTTPKGGASERAKHEYRSDPVSRERAKSES